jgi:hypothetical protein
MSRRTFITSAEIIDLPGELLVTVYDDGATVAYRERQSHSWGPPMIAKETT